MSLVARNPYAVLGPVPVLFAAVGAVQAQKCEARETRHARSVDGEVYGGPDLVLETAPASIREGPLLGGRRCACANR